MLLQDQFIIAPIERCGINLNGQKISGITLENNQIVRSFVKLYCRKSGELIASTISHQDGSYCFNYLDKKESFYVVSLHPEKKYNAVIQDNVVPK